MTRDLCAGHAGVALQANVENKSVCMRNTILCANPKKTLNASSQEGPAHRSCLSYGM